MNFQTPLHAKTVRSGSDINNNNYNDNNKSFSTPLHPLSTEQMHSLRERISNESPNLYRNKMLTDPIQSKYRKFDEYYQQSNNLNNLKQSNSMQSNSLFNNINIDKDLMMVHDNKSNIDKVNSFTTNFNQSQLFEDTLSNTNELLSSTNMANSTNENDFSLLGNYENPLLSKLSKRTINKELELQKIIINIVFLLLGNLISKFGAFFFKYTSSGKIITGIVVEYYDGSLLTSSISASALTDNSLSKNYYTSLIFRNVSWFLLNYFNSLKSLIYLILIFNISNSLWNILSRVKTDDLKLSERQMKLLGLNGPSKLNDNTGSRLPNVKDIAKPHLVVTNSLNSDTTKNTIVGVNATQSVPATPFLFKSLETPLKMKERQQKLIQPQSEMVKSVDAFGNLRRSVLMNNSTAITSAPAPTPNRCGYIPSNKYAYLMDSPSPRKRL